MSLRYAAFVLPLVAACTPATQPQKTQAHVQTTAPVASATAAMPPTPPASSASATPPPPAPNTPTTADANTDELPDRETKLAVGQDTFVVVQWALNELDTPPALSIERREHGKTVLRRLGWKDITRLDWKIVHPCETSETKIVAESLGSNEAIRISLICRTGEDYFTSSEIAIFVKPTTLETLWAGLGDRLESSMDSCIMSRRVTFATPRPGEIEIKTSEITRWVDQNFDTELKSRLKRECKVGTTVRVERQSWSETK